MNKLTMAVSSAVVALSAFPAAAATFSVGGNSITIPNGVHFEVASVYESVLNPALPLATQSLSGLGEITQINGAPTASFCSSNCELTYRFTGYTPTALTASTFTLSGGTYTVFLDFVTAGTALDLNPFASANSAADLAAAINGTAFLNLTGHPDATGATASGFTTSGAFGTPAFSFFAQGNLDVAAGTGIANAAFNTNSIPTSAGPADLAFTNSASTFVVPHPAECTTTPVPTGPECIAGSADIRGVVAVPEPGTLALLGLALAGLGFSRRRARK